MRKGLAHIVIIGVVAILLIGGLSYYALNSSRRTGNCCATPQPTQHRNYVAPTPSEVVNGDTRHIEAAEFILDVPRSWTLEKTSAYKEYYDFLYSDPDTGNYIHLTSQNYPIVSHGADTAWVYNVVGKPPYLTTLQREASDCVWGDSNPYCMAGDGRLMINVAINGLPETFRPVYIEVGNTKIEASSRQIYRDILETLKLRSGYELTS